MVFYISYHGRKIPFGNYVIWDDVNDRFLAFDSMDDLRRAMDKYGYTYNHKTISDGYYTQYGYFSNSILYDLYLKIRYPECYSITAQKTVLKHFDEYNKNPDKFRKKLLENPNVVKEITISHETYEQKRLKEILQEMKRDFELWSHVDVEHIRGAKENLEREIKEYDAIKSYINTPAKTRIIYEQENIVSSSPIHSPNKSHAIQPTQNISKEPTKSNPIAKIPELEMPSKTISLYIDHNKYVILAIFLLVVVIVLLYVIKR